MESDRDRLVGKGVIKRLSFNLKITTSRIANEICHLRKRIVGDSTKSESWDKVLPTERTTINEKVVVRGENVRPSSS